MGVIGLTGGIATGKTLVSDYMKTFGVDVIDGDEITRKLYVPDGPILPRLTAAFGADYLAADGTLDRHRLRDLVFRDAEALKKLNGIVRPAIRDAVVTELLRSRSDHQLLVLPLLIEGGYVSLCDEVWLLYVPEREQLRRLMRRDDLSEDTARGIIGAQLPFAQKRRYAQRIIDNGGAPQKTLARTKKTFSRFLKNFY